MNYDPITDALRLIIRRSAATAGEAAKALQAPLSTRRQRYSAVAVAALGDPEAKWRPDERSLLAINIEPDETRGNKVQVRLSDSERRAVEELAQAAGLNVSEYIRRRLLEPEVSAPGEVMLSPEVRDLLMRVYTVDAMPMMADVVSGSSPRPEPYSGEGDYLDWARQTHAVRRIAETLDEPRDWQLVAGPGEEPSSWRLEVETLRITISDASAGVILTDGLGPDDDGLRLDRYLIAPNEDGTRAAYLSVPEPAAE
jgi:hypothetical protein